MKYKFYVGIDPGLKGGIAILDANTMDIDIKDMPIILEKSKKNEIKRILDIKSIAIILNVFSGRLDTIVILEQQQAFSGQGVCSTFVNGVNYGKLISVLEVLNINYKIVHPKTWQKVFGISSKNGDTKKQSYDIAYGEFPTSVFKLVGKRGGITLLDGRCDATCIALYSKGKE